MSIELPSSLRWLAAATGGQWPDADEDKLWELQRLHQEYAAQARGIASDLDGVMRQVASGVSGAPAEQFAQYLTKVQANLSDVASAADQIADLCDQTALQVQYAKMMVLEMLVWLAAEIAFLIWWAPEAVSGAIAAAEVGIWQIIRKLVMAIGVNMAAAEAMDVLTQGIQFLTGRRHSWDVQDTVMTLEAGAINSVIGVGLFGAGGVFAPKIMGTLLGKIGAGALAGGIGTIVTDEVLGMDGSPLLGFAAGALGGAIGHVPAVLGKGKGGTAFGEDLTSDDLSGGADLSGVDLPGTGEDTAEGPESVGASRTGSGTVQGDAAEDERGGRGPHAQPRSGDGAAPGGETDLPSRLEPPGALGADGRPVAGLPGPIRGLSPVGGPDTRFETAGVPGRDEAPDAAPSATLGRREGTTVRTDGTQGAVWDAWQPSGSAGPWGPLDHEELRAHVGHEPVPAQAPGEGAEAADAVSAWSDTVPRVPPGAVQAATGAGERQAPGGTSAGTRAPTPRAVSPAPAAREGAAPRAPQQGRAPEQDVQAELERYRSLHAHLDTAGSEDVIERSPGGTAEPPDRPTTVRRGNGDERERTPGGRFESASPDPGRPGRTPDDPPAHRQNRDPLARPDAPGSGSAPDRPAPPLPGPDSPDLPTSHPDPATPVRGEKNLHDEPRPPRGDDGDDGTPDAGPAQRPAAPPPAALPEGPTASPGQASSHTPEASAGQPGDVPTRGADLRQRIGSLSAERTEQLLRGDADRAALTAGRIRGLQEQLQAPHAQGTETAALRSELDRAPVLPPVSASHDRRAEATPAARHSTDPAARHVPSADETSAVGLSERAGASGPGPQGAGPSGAVPSQAGPEPARPRGAADESASPMDLPRELRSGPSGKAVRPADAGKIHEAVPSDVEATGQDTAERGGTSSPTARPFVDMVRDGPSSGPDTLHVPQPGAPRLVPPRVPTRPAMPEGPASPVPHAHSVPSEHGLVPAPPTRPAPTPPTRQPVSEGNPWQERPTGRGPLPRPPAGHPPVDRLPAEEGRAGQRSGEQGSVFEAPGERHGGRPQAPKGETPGPAEATPRPKQRTAALLDATRPPRLEPYSEPPARTTGRMPTFADGTRLPAYIDNLRSLMPGATEAELRELLAMPGAFGHSDVTLRGVDDIVAHIRAQLDAHPGTRPADTAAHSAPRDDTGRRAEAERYHAIKKSMKRRPARRGGATLDDTLRKALIEGQLGMTGEGRLFPYRDDTGRIRVLHLRARAYPEWEKLADELGDPTKIDGMHRSTTTAGRSKTVQRVRQVAFTDPVGPVSSQPFSFLVRVSGRVGLTDRVAYTQSDQAVSQTETRTLDGSHVYLTRVYYDLWVTDRDGLVLLGERPDQAAPTGPAGRAAYTGASDRPRGFAVRNGLAVRLPDSATTPSKPGRIPRSMRLDPTSHYRLARSEGFGPVAKFRDWAAAQIGAIPGSGAYQQLDTFFSTESFHRMSRSLGSGRVSTAALFADDKHRTPLGVFTVERLVPDVAVLIDETTQAELRDIAASNVRNERSVARGLSMTLEGAAGPAFNLFDLIGGAIDLRIQFGPQARYTLSSTGTTGQGGSGATRSAGHVKGDPTGLYLVRKTVRVKHAGSAEPAQSFLTWSLDRMTRNEARRLAGWNDMTRLALENGAPEPFAPPYLTTDRPPTLGMHRVEEFAHPDGKATADINGVSRTLLDHFADRAIAAVAQRYPGLVAPLDRLAPPQQRGLVDRLRSAIERVSRWPSGDPRVPRPWKSTKAYQVALSNTLELLNVLTERGASAALEALTTTGVLVRLDEPGTFGQGHRYVLLHGELTSRRYEGVQKDVRVRYSAPGIERQDGQAGRRRLLESGFEAAFSVRDPRKDALPDLSAPNNAGTFSLGGRRGRQSDAESVFGATAGNEAMSVSIKPSHLYRYDLSLTVSAGGYWRPRGLVRGIGTLGLLGTQPFVRSDPARTLVGGVAPHRPALEGPPEGRPRNTAVTPPEAPADRPPDGHTDDPDTIAVPYGPPRREDVALRKAEDVGHPRTEEPYDEPWEEMIGDEAVKGQVLISVPDQHAPQSDPHLPGAVNPYRGFADRITTEPMPRGQAVALAKGDLSHRPGERHDPKFAELQQHPFVLISLVASPELIKAASALLHEASGGAWQLTEEGTPAHEAVRRILQPQYQSAGFDVSSGPLGASATGLMSKGPYATLWATFRHLTTVRGIHALTGPVPMDTETTLAGTRQSGGRTGRTSTLFFGGQFSFAKPQRVGPGVLGTYGVVVSPWSSTRGRSRTILRSVAADMNLKGFSRQVVVNGTAEHLMAVASRRTGSWALGRKGVPRMIAGAAGSTTTVPGGWLGHVPEKSAHRLGLIDDGLGEVPRYADDVWLPQPWLERHTFGGYPVNPLDPTDVLANFQRKARARLGLDEDGAEQLRALVTSRALRAFGPEMADTGASTRVRTGALGWGSIRIGKRTVRAHVELIPGRPEFELLDHSTEMEESRRAVETVQETEDYSAGADIGITVSEAVATGHPTVAGAGPTYAETGSARRTRTSGHTTTSTTIHRATSTEPHAEVVTPYRMRITLEAPDDPPSASGTGQGRKGEEASRGGQDQGAVRRLRTGAARGVKAVAGKARVVEEGDVGSLREHVPLSLMRPEHSGDMPEPDPRLAPPRLVPDRRLRSDAAAEVTSPDTRHGDGSLKPFTFPENGFHVRRIIGQENIQAANAVALARSSSRTFRFTGGDDRDEAAARAQDTSLTRPGSGPAQVLEDGTANSVLTAFWHHTVADDGYTVPGLVQKHLAGTDSGTLVLYSKPDFGAAVLLTVADGKKLEVLRRTAEATTVSDGREGAQDSSLGGGLLIESPGTGLNQFTHTLTGPSATDGDGAAAAVEHLASINVKPKTGRAFLFAVPTTWLSVAHVHRAFKDSALGTFARDAFGRTSPGQKDVGAAAYTVAWVREDIARELGLISDANFPARVSEAWDAVGKASAAWLDADKAYWNLRRSSADLNGRVTDAESIVAATRTGARAAEQALHRAQESARVAAAVPEGEHEATARQEADDLSHRAAARRLADAEARLAEARRALDERRTRLDGLRVTAESAARTYHRTRAGADQLTRWHQLNATEEGRRVLNGLPEPGEVRFTPPLKPPGPPAAPPPPRYTLTGGGLGAGLVSPDGEVSVLRDAPRDGESFFRGLAEGLLGTGRDVPEEPAALRELLADRLTDPDNADLLAFAAPDSTDAFSADEAATVGLDLGQDTPERREFDGLEGLVPHSANLSPPVRGKLAAAQLRRPGDVPDNTGWDHGGFDLLPALAARTFDVPVTVVRADGGFQTFPAQPPAPHTADRAANMSPAPGSLNAAPAGEKPLLFSLADRHYRIALPPETPHQFRRTGPGTAVVDGTPLDLYGHPAGPRGFAAALAQALRQPETAPSTGASLTEDALLQRIAELLPQNGCDHGTPLFYDPMRPVQESAYDAAGIRLSQADRIRVVLEGGLPPEDANLTAEQRLRLALSLAPDATARTAAEAIARDRGVTLYFVDPDGETVRLGSGRTAPAVVVQDGDRFFTGVARVLAPAASSR